MSAENVSAMAEVPRVRVAGSRIRLLMLISVFVIPVGAIALALTFRATDPGPPLLAQTRSGSYEAEIGKPLSVSSFSFVNRTGDNVTIKRTRVLRQVPGVHVIGALAYRGCDACVSDNSVPPHLSSPRADVAPPRLLRMTSFVLKPHERLTVLLSVSVWHTGSMHVPPLQVEVRSSTGTRSMETTRGPVLCAGKNC